MLSEETLAHIRTMADDPLNYPPGELRAALLALRNENTDLRQAAAVTAQLWAFAQAVAETEVQHKLDERIPDDKEAAYALGYADALEDGTLQNLRARAVRLLGEAPPQAVQRVQALEEYYRRGEAFGAALTRLIQEYGQHKDVMKLVGDLASAEQSWEDWAHATDALRGEERPAG